MPYKTYQQGTVSQSSGAAANASMATNQEDVAMSAGTQGATPGKKPFPFPRKAGGGVEKGSGIKPKSTPNSIKKKRINYRLRKIISPKAPIMVLNEMVGAVSYQFVENPPMPMMNPMMAGHLFTAQCVVEGETFSGTGPTKQIAKNIASEHAIQFVVSRRCTDPRNKDQLDETGNPLKPNQMTDETPWAQLASLALFKLFNDWQAQGYTIPPELLKTPDYYNNQGTAPKSEKAAEDTSMPAAGGTPKAGSIPANKSLPENPTERHPVQLLNEMRGPINFQLVEEKGMAPNTIFVLGAEVDGKNYTGEGKNKKDAKKNCAMNILKAIYDLVYPKTAEAAPAAGAEPMVTS